MAVNLPRVNNSALRLAEASRPDKQNFAVCGWAKLNTATATATSLFDYYQDTPSFSWVGFVTASNGTTMTWWSGGTNSTVTTITAGEWFWFATRSNSTTSDMRFWTRSGGMFTASRANTLSAGQGGYFDFGAHTFQEPWDGPVCSVKIFTASITIDELLLEQWSQRPLAVAKLHAWYPMLNTSTTDAIKDYSGNARNLTLAGTTQPTAVVDSPPVVWGPNTTYLLSDRPANKARNFAYII